MTRQHLQRALQALHLCSPRSQDIFTAVYNEGMTGAQAAQRFGISVQRVRQTICEVRKQLREAAGGNT
jgi:RNA polymerase sigma-70 factor (ECF subfamily)